MLKLTGMFFKDQMGNKLKMPGLGYLAPVPSQSLAGWDTSIVVQLLFPHSVSRCPQLPWTLSLQCLGSQDRRQ